MVSKRLAVVLGADSGQGASVVNALLKSGRYRIRGIPRNPGSEGARELARKGVDVMEADLDDPHSLTAPFIDTHVIYGVTKMVEGAMSREVLQGKNIADAAARITTLEHFIWSSLPSASAVSGGKLAVPHMDGKAEVDEYILSSLSALARKTTFLWGGFYVENVLYPNFVPNFVASAGKYVWIQPVHASTLVPMIGDHNTNMGIVVERVLACPELCLPSTYVLAVTEWMANGELLSLWAKVVGEKQGEKMNTVYVHSDIETVDQLWPELGKEMGLMLKVLEDFGKIAWTKARVDLVTTQALGLKVGDGEGDLVSTEKAIRELSRGIGIPSITT
jgi:hypothetical protein